MKNKYFYLFILSSFLLIRMQSLGWGNVREVYESDGATGIQDSINVSGAGDTVLVHDGIYYVRDVDSLGITMKDSIVFMSANGAESCTLTGLNSTATDKAWHVIYCDSISSSSVIQGFTITQGNANGSNPHNRGGGLYIGNYSSPTIIDNIITDNFAGRGGGLFSDGYSFSIVRDNIIVDNHSGTGGGGIYCGPSSFLIIQNNIIKNNYGGSYAKGGGIYCYSCSPTIRDNVIEDNFTSEGGGIYCHLCSLTIQNNIIANNRVDRYGGGGGIGCDSSLLIIRNNIIHSNDGHWLGGGIGYSGKSSLTILHSLFANNKSALGGAIGGIFADSSEIYIDSCFIIDNTGIICFDGDSFEISYSNLYYNTFQVDTEIINDTGMVISLENNFWWDTTESGIAGLIAGPADFTPWEYDFIPGVPGEPVSIDSVRNYDNDYSVIIDSLWDDSNTLYLRIYGEDRNTRFREAAVAIIKSSVYPTGIAVALIETDTSSGIYEGKAIVKTSTGTDNIRTDDIYQTVRVDSVCDSLQIVANMDTAQKFVVYYRICPGVEESESRSEDLSHTRLFQNYPNPFIQSTGIEYELPRDANVSITIYNLLGQRVVTLIKEYKKAGYHRIKWYGKDNYGKKVGSGIYFYKLQTGNYKTVKKMYLMR